MIVFFAPSVRFLAFQLDAYKGKINKNIEILLVTTASNI